MQKKKTTDTNFLSPNKLKKLSISIFLKSIFMILINIFVKKINFHYF